MYKVFRRNQRIAVEEFENDNVRIMRFADGSVETEIKRGCDEKVKRMYKQLKKAVKI